MLWIKKLAATGMAVAMTGLLLTGCGTSSSDPGNGAVGNGAAELKIGSGFEPSSFDPAQAQEGMYIPFYQAAYDTLIKRDPDGSLSPMLATKWTYNSSNTKLTLALREDVKFSDGTRFDSSAVKANLEHFKAANGPMVVTAGAITSIETPDPATAVINLNAPDPALLISLSNAAGLMGSPKALSTDGIKSAPVGSGPYTLAKNDSVVGSRYVFTRNASYWGKQLPYEKISFIILGDETARLNALKSGQVNAALLTQAANVSDAQSAGLKLYPAELEWTGLAFFDRDGKTNPAFGDVRVRQALAYAIDKKQLLNKVLLGQGTLTSQIFGSKNPAYDESLNGAWDYNPDKARKLLADAGYANNLTVDLPISPTFDPTLYTLITQQWADIGVKVHRVEYGPGQHLPALLAGKHGMTYTQFNQPGLWTEISQWIQPKATWNMFHTENSTVTGLIQKIQTGSEQDQAKYGKELNKFLVDNAWFTPFYRKSSLYFADSTVNVQLQIEQAVPSIYNYTPAK